MAKKHIFGQYFDFYPSIIIVIIIFFTEVQNVNASTSSGGVDEEVERGGVGGGLAHTLIFTWVLLRSHFSRGLEGVNSDTSLPSSSRMLEFSCLMTCMGGGGRVIHLVQQLLSEDP